MSAIDERLERALEAWNEWYLHGAEGSEQSFAVRAELHSAYQARPAASGSAPERAGESWALWFRHPKGEGEWRCDVRFKSFDDEAEAKKVCAEQNDCWPGCEFRVQVDGSTPPSASRARSGSGSTPATSAASSGTGSQSESAVPSAREFASAREMAATGGDGKRETCGLSPLKPAEGTVPSSPPTSPAAAGPSLDVEGATLWGHPIDEWRKLRSDLMAMFGEDEPTLIRQRLGGLAQIRGLVQSITAERDAALARAEAAERRLEWLEANSVTEGEVSLALDKAPGSMWDRRAVMAMFMGIVDSARAQKAPAK